MKRIEFVKGQEFLGMRHPVAITSPVDSNVTLIPVTSLPVAIGSPPGQRPKRESGAPLPTGNVPSGSAG